MEATFQSYLTEAVYAMEREKRSQRPISEEAAGENQRKSTSWERAVCKVSTS